MLICLVLSLHLSWLKERLIMRIYLLDATIVVLLDMRHRINCRQLSTVENQIIKVRISRKLRSSASMSEIEAKLEAELERLGLNTNSSTLERRFTDHDEVLEEKRKALATLRRKELTWAKS
ncbi:uncharacterized protein LOC121050326 [Rosa chinensis]|uniref:uncharacterized protein LOC121050326 n=1 Tax=Rosa chinensis TaxID=74649 RepID=UPI001AD8D8AE|nr:uncharacterized protein LOC121050326 [Rosa chinensis]XP_040365881.1 uncharacterized protein LOC121050326 [Rosa chinensis]